MSEAFCKGSISLGTGCGHCSRCMVELQHLNTRALDLNAVAWRYRVVGLKGPNARKFALTEDREYVTELVKHGGVLVEPLYEETDQVINKAAQDALVKIAFDPDVSDLSANPSCWASIIAYLALGGRIQAGKKLDTKEDVLGHLK